MLAPLEEDGVTVEVVHEQEVAGSTHLVHQSRDAFATGESVIVENDDAARGQTWDRPFHGLLCGVVHVNVAMQKRNSPFDTTRGVLRENALEHAHVGQIQAQGQLIDYPLRSIGVDSQSAGPELES